MQAKKVKLIGVKVLDDQGNGQNSDIIAGIQWSVKDAQDNNRVGTSVISLSIDGAYAPASNAAVAAAIKAGVFVAVAAGNNNADTSNYSPASESTVSRASKLPLIVLTQPGMHHWSHR